MVVLVVLVVCEMEVELIQLHIAPKILCNLVIDRGGGGILYEVIPSCLLRIARMFFSHNFIAHMNAEYIFVSSLQ
jgi:hypothetical protein